MEPLIFGLIVMAISAFFTNKKKEEKTAPANQTGKQQERKSKYQGGFQRVEDYAKEIYGDFQSQMKADKDKEEPAKHVAKQVVERQFNRRPARETKQSIEEEAASLAGQEIGGRMSKQPRSSRLDQEQITEESSELFPLTRSEAQKAIVYAEIFMPPKSKRR